MSWLLLTFISVLFRAFHGVCTKVISNKIRVSPYTQATLLTVACAIIALVISPLLGRITTDYSRVSFTALLLVVGGQGIGNVLYFASIRRLTNGTAQVAFSSILVFNTLLALVFLHLQLSFINVFGILLLIIAVLCAVSGKVRYDRRGIALMVCAAFFYAVFQLASSKVSSQISAATYLLIAYGGATLIVFAVKAPTIIHDISKSTYKHMIGLPLLLSVPSIGNFLFAYYAYRAAPQPAIVAILLSSQVVVTVLLSYIILNERDNIGRKVIAAVLVIISALLIKL